MKTDISIPNIVKSDSYLQPYTAVIQQRMNYAQTQEQKICKQPLIDFANGHHFYGLHYNSTHIVIREWAPNATKMFLIGDFSEWQEMEKFEFTKDTNGNFQLELPLHQLKHEDLYKLSVHWNGGKGERIPVWATRVVQDYETTLFSAQVWFPHKTYQWQFDKHRKKVQNPLIYEAHIGMSTEYDEVGTYNDFRLNVLPRIKALGYNVIQLMAIQEHPYYGSFGYHVSSFFAPSSRFGTPEELKQLIDEAHQMEIMVIMDLVHSHAVKNELEGIGWFDGSPNQFFHTDERRNHPVWDSLCFDYQKPEVIHLLLSNIKYWLETYHFDGFRFDGVTSMLYNHHGLGEKFTNYNMYFNGEQNEDAICYLTLANKLMKQINADSISIAEEMSGYPGLASSINDGGLGFDFRLSMGIPDYWIELIKKQKDEDWNVGNIFYELSNKRIEEKTISYVESHDQALVGDKTLIFRLIDKEMYWSMHKNSDNLLVDRGVALHKLIRLLTFSCAGNGYLNFMGNEFGHPEWIDFPREGNNWSHAHARRQWSLADNKALRFEQLNTFDKAMLSLQSTTHFLADTYINCIFSNEGDQVLAIQRKELLFVFNLNPQRSFLDYGIPVKAGKYQIVLNSDDAVFGGFNRVNNKQEFFTIPDQEENIDRLYLYLPNRTALVLQIT